MNSFVLKIHSKQAYHIELAQASGFSLMPMGSNQITQPIKVQRSNAQSQQAVRTFQVYTTIEHSTATPTHSRHVHNQWTGAHETERCEQLAAVVVR